MTGTEQRQDLIRKAQQGDKQAMELLMEQNSPLIWSVARRFFGRGVESDDLFQLGAIGLLKAVEGFDTAFDTQFSTYAVPKIAGEIRRFLRDDGMIKVSRSLKETQGKVAQARQYLCETLGREPRLSELAAETGIPPEEIAAGETACQTAMSLNAEIGEEGFRLMDICPAEDDEDSRIERMAVKSAVRRLPEREQAVILLRYFRDMTQQKTAQALGISQVQVSRLERRAIQRIREILGEG